MFRWVTAQVLTSLLDRGFKIRGVIDCVKAPHGGSKETAGIDVLNKSVEGAGWPSGFVRSPLR